MKRRIILLILVLFIIFIQTCSTELVKGTVWTGLVYRDNQDPQKCEMYLYGDNSIIIYVEMKEAALPGNYFKYEGTYSLSQTDTFKANMEIKMHIDTDPIKDVIELELDGVLSYYTGLAKGDYTLKFIKSADQDESFSDTWALEMLEDE